MPLKYWLVASLIFLIPTAIYAQNKELEIVWPVVKNEALQPGKSAIYGTFIQRLGFSSGGNPQDIILRHDSSGRIYTMRVKGTFKSAKENFFCFHLPSGKYTLLQYYWTKSKWYGGLVLLEPIAKNVNFDEAKQLSDKGELSEERLQRYTFILLPNTLHYMGTWHFETATVSFTDDKQQLDEKVAKMYKRLSFPAAITTLPR